MLSLEVQLRLSVIEAELKRIAQELPPSNATRIVLYAARVLAMVRL